MNGIMFRPNKERVKNIMIPIILMEAGMLLFIGTILKEGFLSSNNFLVFFLSATVITTALVLVKPIFKIFDSKIVIQENEIFFDVVKKDSAKIEDIESVSLVTVKDTGQKSYTKLVFTLRRSSNPIKNLLNLYKKQKVEIVQDIFDKEIVYGLLQEIRARNPYVVIDNSIFNEDFDMLQSKKHQVVMTLAPVFFLSSFLSLIL